MAEPQGGGGAGFPRYPPALERCADESDHYKVVQTSAVWHCFSTDIRSIMYESIKDPGSLSLLAAGLMELLLIVLYYEYPASLQSSSSRTASCVYTEYSILYI